MSTCMFQWMMYYVRLIWSKAKSTTLNSSGSRSYSVK
jgi:hypothetical protein